MQRSSLRNWLLLVAVLFSSLVVGGMAVTTYVVVADGMAGVAQDTTLHVALNAADRIERARTAADEPVPGPEGPYPAEAAALEGFVEGMLTSGEDGSLFSGDFVLYGPTLAPIWYSDEAALEFGEDSQRIEARDSGEPGRQLIGAGGVARGLVGPSSLGTLLVHVPVVLPDGNGVLDVVYYPHREESVIDAIRAPMFTLALSAMFIMVVMMQTSMGWVLKLVDDLRKAADQIDAGRLDVHLPAEGEHEIGELARSINGLIDRLRRRSEAQTRFVADASHELATPVAGIRGYTNILRAWGADDPEVRTEAINAIDRESRRMARLCSDLLALVRDERGVDVRTVRFDINERCRETLAAAATRYMDKGLEFIGPEEGKLYLVSDPDRVEDAISIFVDNAAKYTPDGGSVSVTTRRRRDSIIVQIADTGVGIPPADIDNIFDRFYRSDASRSKETGGFGLGLPIAKSLVDALGGTIEVSSTLGEGTTFTIALPRGKA